jgi:hypothetical protein
MTWHDGVRKQLVDGLSKVGDNPIQQLNNALRLLSKHRSVLIQNTLIQNEGLKVMQGPLEGLDFISQSAEGCHVAKLIGCYEQPLQEHMHQVIKADYDTVINIGCAEGYYAVGMALKMEGTHTYAFDINQAAQTACADLAQKNGIADRITVGATFEIEDFAKYLGGRSLVFCDIEGAEVELLDPEKAPQLKSFDIIVEAHEGDRPGTVKLLSDRFAPTHSIELVHDDGQRNLDNMPGWFLNLSHLDQLLATWEWRSGPTPWMVMKVK